MLNAVRVIVQNVIRPKITIVTKYAVIVTAVNYACKKVYQIYNWLLAPPQNPLFHSKTFYSHKNRKSWAKPGNPY